MFELWTILQLLLLLLLLLTLGAFHAVTKLHSYKLLHYLYDYSYSYYYIDLSKRS